MRPPARQHRPVPRTTLLDVLVRPTSARLRPEVEAILKFIPSARRYVFDAEASARVGEFHREHLDLMIENVEFARPPFPTTYIEIDARAMWHGWRPDQPALPTSDTTIGFLAHGDAVVVLTEAKGVFGSESMVAYNGFRINKPQSIPLDRLTGFADERADAVKQAYVFGGQRYVVDPADYSPKQLGKGQEIRLPDLPFEWTHAQVAAHFDIRPSYVIDDPRTFVENAFRGGGDPMTALVALLLLNQPSEVIDLRTEPAGRTIFRGKLKSYREHHVVTIRLDQAVRILKGFEHSDRASPVFHNVEGHWKNYNKSPRCIHNWEPIGVQRTTSGDYRHYWCPRCFQRKTWTEAFGRGDSLRGVAMTEYRVKR